MNFAGRCMLFFVWKTPNNGCIAAQNCVLSAKKFKCVLPRALRSRQHSSVKHGHVTVQTGNVTANASKQWAVPIRV
jgi:hypothetical protein